jgi:hypothetical protein
VLPATLWQIVRHQPPVPEHLILRGALLQVLGDALVREKLSDAGILKRPPWSCWQRCREERVRVSHELRTFAAIFGWANVLKLEGAEQLRRRFCLNSASA